MDIKEKDTGFSQYPAEKKDFIFGIIAFIFFGFLMLQSFSIEAPRTLGVAGTVIDASFYPFVFCGIGCVISLALIILNGIKIRRFNKQTVKVNPCNVTVEEKTPTRRKMIPLCIVFMFIYIFLINRIGILFASMLYLIAQITALTKKEDRGLKGILTIIVLSIGIPLVIYIPFRYIFGISFPMGIFR